MKLSPLLIMFSVVSLTLLVLNVDGTASAFEPVEMRSVHITDVEVTTDSVTKLDLDKLLLEEVFEPDQDPRDSARERQPEAEKMFVILEVIPKEEKSIGKYDYRLQAADNDESFPCIGISVGGEPFDPRLWELTAEDVGVDSVRLLYEVNIMDGEEVELLIVPAMGLPLHPGSRRITVPGLDNG